MQADLDLGSQLLDSVNKPYLNVNFQLIRQRGLVQS